MPSPVLFFCNADKSPTSPYGLDDGTADLAALQDLARRYWGPLRGLVLGDASGVDQLDVDIRPAFNGFDTLAALDLDLPPTLTASSPSGGRHYFFQHLPGTRLVKLGPGLDWRATGHYACIPPGPGREWIDRTDPAEAPSRLVELVLAGTGDTGHLSPANEEVPIVRAPNVLTVHPRSREASYAHIAYTNATSEFLRACPGERNVKLNALAYGLGRLAGRGWITTEDIVRGLELCARFNGLIRDDGRAQFRATLISGLRAGMARPYPDLNERCLPKEQSR